MSETAIAFLAGGVLMLAGLCVGWTLSSSAGRLEEAAQYCVLNDLTVEDGHGHRLFFDGGGGATGGRPYVAYDAERFAYRDFPGFEEAYRHFESLGRAGAGEAQ